ncbi:MAG TPA: cysteine dioxygenase family protein [Opitutaceae bacterium]
MPLPLQSLVAYLDGLKERASIETLRDLLGASNVSLDDLKPYVCFKDEAYQRVLICSGEQYEMLVVCWKSGQRSPIHDHAGSTCCFRVMQGVCTETVFDFSPCGQVVARDSKNLLAGYIAASQDTDTHQVSNLQTPGQDLVTLHIYSPPLQAMRKYSLTGERDGNFAPGVSICRAEEEG